MYEQFVRASGFRNLPPRTLQRVRSSETQPSLFCWSTSNYKDASTQRATEKPTTPGTLYPSSLKVSKFHSWPIKWCRHLQRQWQRYSRCGWRRWSRGEWRRRSRCQSGGRLWWRLRWMRSRWFSATSTTLCPPDDSDEDITGSRLITGQPGIGESHLLSFTFLTWFTSMNM